MAIESHLGVDAIQNEQVENIVSIWRRIVEIRQGGGRSFSMFWLAGPVEKTTQAIDYIAKQLSIDRNATIEFLINPDQWDVTENLYQLGDRVKSIDGNRVLVIARGFETVLVNTTEPYRLSRAGHDWDQNVFENSQNTRLGKLYSRINKHMVIITTIGFSAGKPAYDKAVKSAVLSQFKSGMIELE